MDHYSQEELDFDIGLDHERDSNRREGPLSQNQTQVPEFTLLGVIVGEKMTTFLPSR